MLVCFSVLPAHWRGGRLRVLDAWPELLAGLVLLLGLAVLSRAGAPSLNSSLALACVGRHFAFRLLGPLFLRTPGTVSILLALPFLAGCWYGLWRAQPESRNRTWRCALVLGGFLLPVLLAQTIAGPGLFRGPAVYGHWGALALLALLSTIPGASLHGNALSGRALAGWTLAALSLSLGFQPFAGYLRAERRVRTERELAAIEAATPVPLGRRDWFHRGVNFTANGISYESPLARDLLRRLPEFGVRDIALVPFAYTDRETGAVRRSFRDSWESDDGVRLLAAEARRLGMRVLLKPHVWRPRARPLTTTEERIRWLRTYEPVLVHYAKLASRIQAEIFCIGVELAGLSAEEQEWRRLIRVVREHYRGPLVYAATQGPEFESIRFWDALDYIGLDNYYPLGPGYNATDMVARIQRAQKEFSKPVLLTEAGFSSSPSSHLTPWDDRREGPVDLMEQVRSYEAVYRALYPFPWFRGVYWWKIETDRTGGPDHPGMAPWDKPAMEVIRRWNRKAHSSETSSTTSPSPSSESARTEP